MITEIINNMQENKAIVEELISIDNEKMLTSISFEDYISSLKSLDKEQFIPLNPTRDILFMTEGNPILTINLLRRLDANHNYVIFINQGYVAMNKWFITEYIRITGHNNVELDTNINYNDYMELNYKVIPLGEDNFIDSVMEDFYAN